MTQTADALRANAPWLAPFPRRYVPTDHTIDGVADIEPLYRTLIDRPIESPEAFAEWIAHWSEVRAVVDEHSSRVYVAMTCRTDDEAAKNAYLTVVREIEPKVTEWENRLDQKFLASPHRGALDKKEYGRFDQMIATSVELFIEKNIPLSTQLSELSQQYQELSGSLTVTFDGEEKTLQQMGVYLREPDRAIREKAWKAVSERRLAEAGTFEAIFSKMMPLRHAYARNLGLADYRAYAFKSKLRDYTPADCEAFHQAVEKTAIPLMKKIHERRRVEMGLDTLKPWDLACDPMGRPPLRPFKGGDELFDKTAQVFEKVDDRLGRYFRSIGFSMDLESRKGKAPGGYQITYEESRIPFIFTNAVGLFDDVNTLLHEGGHAFHTLASRDNDLPWYRHAPMEFSEVASMSMELIGGEFLDPFSSDVEALDRVSREKLEGVVSLFGWVATVDAFQSWLYTHPDHTEKERGDYWMSLLDRFDTGVDYEGLPEEMRRYQWHRQLHIFEVPFYYIEYAIAQLGALQIWARYNENPQQALDDYLSALSRGGSVGPSALFDAAGIRFDFTEATLGGLMEMVAKKLGL